MLVKLLKSAYLRRLQTNILSLLARNAKITYLVCIGVIAHMNYDS